MGSIGNEFNFSSLPYKLDTIRQVRTGKVKPVFDVPGITSAIYKKPLTDPVKVGVLGCEDDERSYEPHRGPDNALMHYCSEHYKLWQKEIPHNAPLFTVGAFGENLVSSNISEETICIGDTLQLGDDILIQVTKPRMPCFKLNHRFQIKDMSLRCQNLNRTGWYYRVLRGGWLQPGDTLVLLERKYPQWTIARIQDKLFKDVKDEQAMKELAYLPELGQEIKTIFLNRLTRKLTLMEERANDAARLGLGDLKWVPYVLKSKTVETSRVSSFIFEAISPTEIPEKVEPGSHVRVKLGKDGKLVRAYSVVNGDSNTFELGIAYDEETSRGGSMHMHKDLKIGEVLSFSELKSDFPVEHDAHRHILIAGGIGITAFIATARYLQKNKQDYHLFYAIRSSKDKAFERFLDDLKPNVTILNGSKGQRLDIPGIIGRSNDQTHIYVCGSDRLMKGVISTAQVLHFPTSNIHSEAFATATSGDPFTVELAKSKTTLEVKEEQILLDVLREAGLDIPSTCEVGNCGTCKVEVCSGRVDHRGTGLIEVEKKTAMLSCVSRGIGRITLDL
jgi:MOSC domain-containing protein YiiM/ferredoxin-NADP reductase